MPTPSNHILSRESTGQRQKLPFPHSRCGTPTGRPTGLTTPSPSGLVRQRQTTLFRDQRQPVLSAHGISTGLSGEKWGMENSLFSLTEPPPNLLRTRTGQRTADGSELNWVNVLRGQRSPQLPRPLPVLWRVHFYYLRLPHSPGSPPIHVKQLWE